MSGTVGWVVIARDTPAANQISVRGIFWEETVPDVETALQVVRTKLVGGDQLFRIAAFGMMSKKDEHISKRNLANALHELGLPVLNLDQTYREVSDYIIRLSQEMKHSH